MRGDLLGLGAVALLAVAGKAGSGSSGSRAKGASLTSAGRSLLLRAQQGGEYGVAAIGYADAAAAKKLIKDGFAHDMKAPGRYLRITPTQVGLDALSDRKTNVMKDDLGYPIFSMGQGGFERRGRLLLSEKAPRDED